MRTAAEVAKGIFQIQARFHATGPTAEQVADAHARMVRGLKLSVLKSCPVVATVEQDGEKTITRWTRNYKLPRRAAYSYGGGGPVVAVLQPGERIVSRHSYHGTDAQP